MSKIVALLMVMASTAGCRLQQGHEPVLTPAQSLQQAASFDAIGDIRAAQTVREELVRRHPTSSASALAVVQIFARFDPVHERALRTMGAKRIWPLLQCNEPQD